MNRLDHSVIKHDVAKVIIDLTNIVNASVKPKRTPSDLTEKIVLICADLRRKNGALESEIADLEDYMWMADTAVERLMDIAMKYKMIEVIK